MFFSHSTSSRRSKGRADLPAFDAWRQARQNARPRPRRQLAGYPVDARPAAWSRVERLRIRPVAAWAPRTATASVRSPIVPVDCLPVTVAINPPAWVWRLPRGLALAFLSVLIPGCAARWLQEDGRGR
jgi:hypothetical protein